MDKKEIKEYNDVIRRMLEHEDEVRSKRTNWFLVLQGLLINGILMVLTAKDSVFQTNDSIRTIVISLLLVIGTLVSFSFFHAARLSFKAYGEGKRFWENVLLKIRAKNYPYLPVCLLERDEKNKAFIKNYPYPPVCLLEEEDKDKLSSLIFSPFIFYFSQGKLKNKFLPCIFLPFLFYILEGVLLIYTIWTLIGNFVTKDLQRITIEALREIIEKIC